MSALTFGVYGWDKSAAGRNGSRAPEKTLHTQALLGGWPGAMIAQQVLRHKSSKESFRAVFWLTVLINIALLAGLMTESGAGLLEGVLRQF